MLVQRYRDMLRLRLVEEAIATRYAEWEMRCPVHLSIGQEPAAVGACAALERRDYAFGGHRAHGHYLAKGGDLRAMLAELYGRATGCARGKGGSMHLIDIAAGFLGAVPIVGSTIPIAVGAAFGVKQAKEDRVVAAFFGDGATEEGVFAESLDFAALHRLPMVFVCENNLYSVYSPITVRQAPERDLVAIAAGHGVPGRSGDGNDVELVESITREAVDRARRGDGPSVVNFDTYRWREHCGPFMDDQLGYRPKGELAAWQARCGLQRLEERLRREGRLDEARKQAIVSEVEAELAAAFDHARSSPFPSPDELAKDIYGPGVA